MRGTMRTIPRAALAVLVVAAAAAAAEVTGALQVTCRPGHRVYLDGEFVGLTTAEQDGLHLKAVVPGAHEVRVEKLERKPRTLTVTVIAERAVEVRVPDLEPENAEEPTPAATAAPQATPPATAAPAAIVAGVAITAAPVAAIAAEAPVSAPAAEPVAAASAAAAVSGETPAPSPAAPPPAAVPAPTGQARPVTAAPGVGFVYQATGTALASGPRSVSIFRERGGPKVPVLAFVCSAPSAGCSDQTPASFAPGSYRFRVVCREAGAARRDPDVFNRSVTVELDAAAGQSWELAASYELSPPRCEAVARLLD